MISPSPAEDDVDLVESDALDELIGVPEPEANPEQAKDYEDHFANLEVS
jgi:hypothetical protein